MKKIVIIFLTISLTLEYYGVDLSAYDEEVDWEKLSKQIDFVIIKAGAGFDYIDREFEKNATYHPKGIVTPEDVFELIADIKPSKENILDQQYAKKLVLTRKKENYQGRF